MKRFISILLLSLLCLPSAMATTMSEHDSIVTITKEDIVGRWMVSKENDQSKDIYVFRADDTFHKAVDNSDLLFFNVAGKYRLIGDTIRVVYQDLSRSTSARVAVSTMYLKVTSLSEDKISIIKILNKRTEFLQFKRVNKD